MLKYSESVSNKIKAHPITVAITLLLTLAHAWDYSYELTANPSGDLGGEHQSVRSIMFFMLILAAAGISSRVGLLTDRSRSIRQVLASENINFSSALSTSRDSFVNNLNPRQSPNMTAMIIFALAYVYAVDNFLLKGISMDPGGNHPEESRTHFAFDLAAFSLAAGILGYGLDRLNEFFKILSPEQKPLLPN